MRKRALVLKKETLTELTPGELQSVAGAIRVGTIEIEVQRPTIQNPFTCTFISQAVETCPFSDRCTQGC